MNGQLPHSGGVNKDINGSFSHVYFCLHLLLFLQKNPMKQDYGVRFGGAECETRWYNVRVCWF